MRTARFCQIFSVVAALLFGPQVATAAPIAVFGNNTGFANLATSLGNTVTVVTDAQVASAGFLDSFDLFVYTRDNGSFGSPLSAAASANVAAFVSSGPSVLFNGDWFDELTNPTPTTPQTQQLISNAIAFALNGGHGFLGEFDGAVAGLTSNVSGYPALNLITGAATTALAGGGGGSFGAVSLTAAGSAHPITAGVGFPYNPGQVEFGATITGAAASNVLAVYDNGNAAILATSGAAVPEPATLILLGSGLTAAYARKRRTQRNASTPVT